MGKGKRHPKGFQPKHPARAERAKVNPQDVAREREVRLRIPEELYRFLQTMSERASIAAGTTVSPHQTAEILLTHALLDAAEAYQAALIEERAALERAQPQLELPFGVQREQEEASEGAA